MTDYKKWDSYTATIDSDDEDLIKREENTQQHEIYRKWQWDQAQEDNIEAYSKQKQAYYTKIGSSGSANMLKMRMKERAEFPQKTLSDYAWVDHDSSVAITVRLPINQSLKLSGIYNLDGKAEFEKKIDVSFRPFSVDAIIDLGSEYALFAIPDLSKEIVPDSSTYKFQMNGFICFNLKKLTREHWSNLKRGGD